MAREKVVFSVSGMDGGKILKCRRYNGNLERRWEMLCQREMVEVLCQRERERTGEVRDE